MFCDGSILKLSSAEKLQYDFGDHKEFVSVEEAKKAYDEYIELIMFLQDWDTGAFTVSYNEYFTLPAILLDYRRVYNNLCNARKRK